MSGFASGSQTKKLGGGLTFEGAGASFIGSGQTTTLNCAGGGAHILGSNNTLTLTGACKWLDMVGSNNTVIVAFQYSHRCAVDRAALGHRCKASLIGGLEPRLRNPGRGSASRGSSV